MGHWISAKAGMTGVPLSVSMLNRVSPIGIPRIKGCSGFPVLYYMQGCRCVKFHPYPSIKCGADSSLLSLRQAQDERE